MVAGIKDQRSVIPLSSQHRVYEHENIALTQPYYVDLMCVKISDLQHKRKSAWMGKSSLAFKRRYDLHDVLVGGDEIKRNRCILHGWLDTMDVGYI